MTTQYLFSDINSDEGVKLMPYKDRLGNWTIGIGHNIDADPAMKAQLPALLKTGITMQQAQDLFNQDVAKAEAKLDELIPWWRQLDDVRQDVIVNMSFNMGTTNFVTGWPRFLALIQSGDYAGAARKLRNAQNYINQVHGRAIRLADQLEKGVRTHETPA